MSTATAVEQVRSHVVQLAREIETLAEGNLPPHEFFDQFLQRLLTALGARAGVVWLRDGGEMRAVSQKGLAEIGLQDPKAERLNRRLLGDVLSTGETSSHSPDDVGDAELPTPHFIVLGALSVGKGCVGAVQVFQRPDIPRDARPGYLQFVEQMCGYGSQYLERQRSDGSAQNQTTSRFWEDFEPYALKLQQSLDVQEVAATAANDGRLLLGVDRVSVALHRGAKTTVQAISGQDAVNQRANLVRAMTGLASKVIAMREPVIYTGSVGQLAPQVEESLAHYVQESGSRMVMILPLFESSPLIEPEQPAGKRHKPEYTRKAFGCLIVERVSDSRPPAMLQERVTVTSQHVAAALFNARAQQRIFLLSLWRLLGRSLEWFHGRKLAKLVAALAVITTVVLALALVPWEYRVEGDGRLMPVVQRHVFAPWEGEVVQVFVEGGQPVKQGQVLVKLRNDELLAQVLAARNDLNEKQQLIFALHAQIDDAIRNVDRDEELRLQGRLVETQINIEGIQEQLAILEERQALMEVRAPINGVVATFQVDQLLRNRPVRRGEVLLEVMDDGGPWRLELEVPEHRMGHVLRAAEQRQAFDLPVEFILATATEVTFRGQLESIATRSAAGEGGTVVEVYASLEPDQIPTRRIGADVRAKIGCGQRSLGYVLFGDVVEFVRKRLWL